MLVYEKTSVYLAIELSLTEIYYILYAGANDAKIVRTRNAQCKTRESPLKENINLFFVTKHTSWCTFCSSLIAVTLLTPVES